VGIEPRYHEKIFGLFERLHEDKQGTGIGLALVKRIIELHDGHIWVESQGKGCGSAFCFTLFEQSSLTVVCNLREARACLAQASVDLVIVDLLCSGLS
jgi:light-regulated signal transduction histidine kinase (bacteriophytochrome)